MMMFPTIVSVPAHHRILYILHRKKESERKMDKARFIAGHVVCRYTLV